MDEAENDRRTAYFLAQFEMRSPNVATIVFFACVHLYAACLLNETFKYFHIINQTRKSMFCYFLKYGNKTRSVVFFDEIGDVWKCDLILFPVVLYIENSVKASGLKPLR